MDELSPELQAWLLDFVNERQAPEEVSSWVEAISNAVLAEVAEVVDDPALEARLRAAVRDHWNAFLAQQIDPARPFALPTSAGEIAADLARRGFTLPVALRIYRVAQRAVWDSIATAIITEQRTDDPARALRIVWTRASDWLDASVEVSIEIFQDEQERVRQGRNARVLEAVRGVLDGGRPDLRTLSATLDGHPLSELQTALILNADEPAAVGDLLAAATKVGNELRARNRLVVSPGGRDLWCWLATREAPALSTLNALETWLAERHITVAVGGSAAGVEGFAQSHTDAREAQRILFATGQRSHVARYRDVELLALMSARPEPARRFAERVLGPLSHGDENVARLRETVEAVLNGGGVDVAAKALVVHRNTIRYRMRQAEELLGRPVASDATEIAAALRYHRAFLSADQS